MINRTSHRRSMSPLRQPFQIFRKDATHLWPETLVYFALLAAFAWADAQTWAPTEGFNPATLGVGFLRFLIVVSWVILISRLVHDEELVGDRQFWITRPYTWYGLLSAKLIYIVAFIGLPFLLMQMWLLHHAGLYPTLLLGPMLKNLLYIALLFLLPLLALAAVTSTFVRFISTVLGGLIYLFAVIAIVAYNLPDSLGAPYIEYLVSAALIATLLAAIIVQYWRRKTLVARVLLGAVPLVIVLIAALVPVNLLVAHRYPDVSNGTAAFDSDPARRQPEGRVFSFQHKVVIDVPVQAQLKGIDTDSALSIQRVRIHLTAPNGFHYTSDWSSANSQFLPERPAGNVQFRLPQSVWDKVHNQPVSLHLELGTQVLGPGKPYTVPATESAFPLPGHAACTLSNPETTNADGTPGNGTLDCRFPFGVPVFTRASATVHEGDCSTPGPRSAQAYAAFPPSNAIFAFSPVDVVRVGLSLGQTKVPLCPGTPTTFTPAIEGAYGRMSFDIPSITLDPYAYRIPTRPSAGRPPEATTRP